MKIVLPFQIEAVLSPDQLSLLEKLGLDFADPINHILLHWNTYVFGSADLIYEQTIDDLFEFLYHKHGYSDEWYRMQMVLSEYSDQIVETLNHLAKYLHHLLDTYPDEHARRSLGEADFHYLRVLSIDLPGQFLILTSDVIDG